MLFEVNMGKGKLLMTTIDLTDGLAERPVDEQLKL